MKGETKLQEALRHLENLKAQIRVTEKRIKRLQGK